ncbi:MAG TPA: transcriptional repressor LexA [Phototrophicaceae bacterium]|nr:transcriptional repressor LexA [Phototrophicaceae bacterium]
MRDRSKLSERQRNILRYMESYIDTHGFPPTIREIGLATGINSTSVVNYNLNKLVEAGHLSREARASRGLRLVKNGRSKSSAQPVIPASQFVRVRLAGQIVASAPAPIPDEMDRTFDDSVEVTPTMLNGAPESEVFALKVKGDSMIDAMISDGDIVLFRKQQEAQNGDMVAVWLPERSETTLKYFYRESDTKVRLQPAHPTMDPIYVHPANVQIQGRVLSVIRPRV